MKAISQSVFGYPNNIFQISKNAATQICVTAFLNLKLKLFSIRYHRTTAVCVLLPDTIAAKYLPDS